MGWGRKIKKKGGKKEEIKKEKKWGKKLNTSLSRLPNTILNRITFLVANKEFHTKRSKFDPNLHLLLAQTPGADKC